MGVAVEVIRGWWKDARTVVRRVRRVRHPAAEAATAAHLTGVVWARTGLTWCFLFADGGAYDSPLVRGMLLGIGTSSFGSLDRALAAANRVYRRLSPAERMAAMSGTGGAAAAW